MKYYLALAVIVVALISAAYFLGNKAGKDSAQVSCQSTVILQQDAEIKESEKVSIRKEISKSFSTNDNIEWLRAHRCKDCAKK